MTGTEQRREPGGCNTALAKLPEGKPRAPTTRPKDNNTLELKDGYKKIYSLQNYTLTYNSKLNTTLHNNSAQALRKEEN